MIPLVNPCLINISSPFERCIIAFKNYYILSFFTAVKYRAKEFHKTIPEPITVNELLTGKKMPETLVIDEALIVLERLIAGIYDLNNKQPPRIIAETLSDEKNKDRVALFPRDGTDMYTVVDLKDRWVL